MYSIGENVAYPMHGACVVVSIEEHIIDDEARKYYILRPYHGEMQLMVPIDSADKVGLRDIAGDEAVKSVYEILAAEATPMPSNWNKRNRENMDKLKTGDILQVAEVVRNLMRSNSQKKLSTGEKKMMTTAKNLLISEIVIAKSISSEEAADEVKSAIFGEECTGAVEAAETMETKEAAKASL